MLSVVYFQDLVLMTPSGSPTESCTAPSPLISSRGRRKSSLTAFFALGRAAKEATLKERFVTPGAVHQSAICFQRPHPSTNRNSRLSITPTESLITPSHPSSVRPRHVATYFRSRSLQPEHRRDAAGHRGGTAPHMATGLYASEHARRSLIVK